MKNSSRSRFRYFNIVLAFCASFLLVLDVSVLVEIARLNSPGFIESLEYHRPPDVVPPEITLKGDAEMKVALGTSYVEPGFEASDDWFDVEVEVAGEVDANTLGEYELEYTAIDSSGNTATEKRIVRVVEPTGVVYLTFDDGPGPYTGRLLDILDKYGVKATFFVTGAGDDELIRREYDEGHSVALHTNSHNYAYVYASMDNFFEDLYAIQARVKSITGHTSMLMRFPGGSSNLVSARYDGGSRIMSSLVQDVTNRGFTYFDWNISSGDAGGTTSSDQVYLNVVDRLIAGGSSVVLQHDIKEYSVDAVERIIQYGLEQGYIFARLEATSFTAHHGVNN